jgi:hypothetical protein
MYVTEKEKGKLGGKRTLKREKEKNHFFLNLHSEKENFQFFSQKLFIAKCQNFLPKENHFKLETQGFTVNFSFKQKIRATFVKCKNQEEHFYGIVLANVDNMPFKVIRS